MAESTVTENAPQHTSGPWSVVKSSHQREFTHWIERPASVELDRETVAAVLNLNESDANAQLIAAAPRMFDALKGMVGLIQLLPLSSNDRIALQRNHRYIEALETLAAASESEHV